MSTGYPTWEETQLRNIEHFDRILDQVGELAKCVDELRRGMAAVVEVMATRADQDDLRSEMLGRIAEATATPFHGLQKGMDDAL